MLILGEQPPRCDALRIKARANPPPPAPRQRRRVFFHRSGRTRDGHGKRTPYLPGNFTDTSMQWCQNTVLTLLPHRVTLGATVHLIRKFIKMPHLTTPVTATFEYIDVDGIETRRRVDVYRTAKAKGHTRITGWCHGRQAERVFRSDRLQAVITEDGEVLSAGEFLASITPDKSRDVIGQGTKGEDDTSSSFLESLLGLAAVAVIGYSIFIWVTEDGANALTFLGVILLLSGVASLLWQLVRRKRPSDK